MLNSFQSELIGIERGLRSYLKEVLKPTGLNVVEMATLGAVCLSGKISQKEIIAGMGEHVLGYWNELPVDKGAMTRAVKSLEGKGMITRSDNPTDSRSYLFEATETGLIAAINFKEMYDEWASHVFDGIDELELETCAAVLFRVKENAKWKK